MANELRVRQNFIGGTITDNPLALINTSFSSAALAAVTAIGTTQHMAVVLDPMGVNGAPEIVWITAHTAASTTATILRARESTVAREHPTGTAWVAGATAYDTVGEPWATPTFQNNWVNYGSGYNNAAYRRQPDHTVRLRGMVKNGTINTAIFTLPTGFRPGARQLMSGISNDAPCRIDIQTDGTVWPVTGNNAWVSLDGLSFFAEG